MKTTSIVIGTLMCGLLPVASTAHAGGPPDHYRCYKVADHLPKNEYTLDPATSISSGGVNGLDPDVNDSNCTVKVPPKLACFPAGKFPGGSSPPPSGSGPTYGSEFTDRPYLCYQTKCARLSVKTVPAVTGLEDQFGSHSLTLKAQSKLVCAPACGVTGTPCYANTQCCSNVCSASACSP